MKQYTILVTGGAGYIGGYTVKALQAAGYATLVLDPVASPHHGASLAFTTKNVTRAFELRSIDAVVHLAGSSSVVEGEKDPIGYYANNVGSLLDVLAAMKQYRCNKLVFASSAAVYRGGKVSELTPPDPTTIYGRTKGVCEHIIEECRVNAFVLRYFNVAGGRDPNQHLIPAAFRATAASPLRVRDMNHIRDYVHVHDVAAINVRAVDALIAGKTGRAFNVCSGTGYTVDEVLKRVGQVPWVGAPPLTGEPQMLVGIPSAAQHLLGWGATQGLDAIIRSARENA